MYYRSPGIPALYAGPGTQFSSKGREGKALGPGSPVRGAKEKLSIPPIGCIKILLADSTSRPGRSGRKLGFTRIYPIHSNTCRIRSYVSKFRKFSLNFCSGCRVSPMH